MKTIYKIAICSFLLLAATPIVAAQSGGGTIPSFDSWLEGVSGPLLGSILATLLSWVTEYFPEYDYLSKRVKMFTYLGLCVVLSVGAASLRAVLHYVPWSFDPLIWHALWSALAQFGVGAFVHEFWPAKKQGEYRV